MTDNITIDDKITVAGIGVSGSGKLVYRRKNDNKQPPFWGTSYDGKRLKAVRLAEFKAVQRKA